jgi:hypothetical protein
MIQNLIQEEFARLSCGSCTCPSGGTAEMWISGCDAGCRVEASVDLGVEHAMRHEVCSWFLESFDEAPYSSCSKGYEKSANPTKKISRN